MARLFPLRSETPTQEGQPRVVDLEDEDADAVFGALSSTTARRIYTRLNDEPATPSDVAEAIDSSIQNVRYHLEKLEDAGLIEVVDTWYSSRGNEMSVYAPADGPLIVTSDRSRATQLREALSRYLGGITVLAGASLFVQYGLDRMVSPLQSSFGWGAPTDDAGTEGGNGGDGSSGAGDGNGNGNDNIDTSGELDSNRQQDGGTDDVADGDAPSDDFTADPESVNDSAGTPTDDGGATDGINSTPTDDGGATDAVANGAENAAEAGDALVASLPPGLLFFLGGLLVLTVVMVWWYRSGNYQS